MESAENSMIQSKRPYLLYEEVWLCLRVRRELMKVYFIREVILSKVVYRKKMSWQ